MEGRQQGRQATDPQRASAHAQYRRTWHRLAGDYSTASKRGMDARLPKCGAGQQRPFCRRVFLSCGLSFLSASKASVT